MIDRSAATWRRDQRISSAQICEMKKKFPRTPDREKLHGNKKNARIQTLKIHQKFNSASILKIQKKVARRQLGLIPYRTAKNLDHPKKIHQNFTKKVYFEKFTKNSILPVY